MTTQTKDTKKPTETTPDKAKAAPKKAPRKTPVRVPDEIILTVEEKGADGLRVWKEIPTPGGEKKTHKLAVKNAVKSALKKGDRVEDFQGKRLRVGSFGEPFVLKATVQEQIKRRVTIDESSPDTPTAPPPAGTP